MENHGADVQHIISSLLLLLVTARVLGRAFKVIGQQEIVGEIVAGLLLGPMILGMVLPSPQLFGIVELAVFLIIFGAGLEMDLFEVMAALKKKAFMSAAFAFGIPLASGVGVGMMFNLGIIQSVCIGLVLAITALPVVIRMLSTFKLTDHPLGATTIGAAIIIDVIALLLLGVVFSTDELGNLQSMLKSIGGTVLKLTLFFTFVFIFNRLLRRSFMSVKRTKNIVEKVGNAMGSEGTFGLAILFVLLFSTVSEFLGLHFIIGAFFGGLLLNKDIMGKSSFKEIETSLFSISNGFLTPIFFASIGMQLSTKAFEHLDMLAAILAIALVSKFVGGWLGAKLGGMEGKDPLRIGILLNSRGVLDLVIAGLALERGYIDESVFSILVIVGVVSTILVPSAYKKLVPQPKKIEEAAVV